jgi:hypothetical protein
VTPRKCMQHWLIKTCKVSEITYRKDLFPQ